MRIMSLFVLLSAVIFCPIVQGAGGPKIPEGGTGIAAKYPEDVGIGKDPAVLLAEDFEDMPPIVNWMRDGGWFQPKIGPGLGLELTDKIPAAGGRQSLQFNHKQGKKTAGSMMHKLPGGLERVYIRYYRRFERDWQWPDGYGPHDVGLYAYLGNFRSPTQTHLHVLLDLWKTGDTVLRIGTPSQTVKNWTQYYKANYKGMAGLWGGVPWNVSKPDRIVNTKWHCIEYMVQLSTPGQKDGITRLWVNGKLVSNITDLPLRDVAHKDMKSRLFFICAYFHPGMPKDQKHWFDQVVLARKYIGPIERSRPKTAQRGASGSVAVRLPGRTLAPGDPLAPHVEALAAAELAARSGDLATARAAYETIAEALPEGSPRQAMRVRAEGARLRETLIGAIRRGFAASGPKEAYIDLMGRAKRARLTALSETSATFTLQGGEFPMDWTRIAPRRLAGIATRYAASAAGHLDIAKFLAACGETEAAHKTVDRALAAGPTAEETALARRISRSVQ